MIDDKVKELKELSHHDIEEEKKLRSLSVYEYYFHLESLSQSNKKIIEQQTKGIKAK